MQDQLGRARGTLVARLRCSHFLFALIFSAEQNAQLSKDLSNHLQAAEEAAQQIEHLEAKENQLRDQMRSERDEFAETLKMRERCIADMEVVLLRP